MIRMKERSATDGIIHHAGNPVRVYSEDEVQKERIALTLEMCRRCLQEERIQLHSPVCIELGCGTADVSGALSGKYGYGQYAGWHFLGLDCNQACLLEARIRYDHRYFTPIHGAIAPAAAGTAFVDLLILSETLEHLDDPNAVASSWLKRSDASVISHPLNESPDSQLSGGDHCWSFSMEDHLRFFELGGHEVTETRTVKVGLYDVVISRSRRRIC